ncbi:MAG TPA: hypothetical protein EYP59_07840 [Thiotrichaceae bacterium]|nr:hypothetical protein [Thiotrichaceae bacterium]
MLRVSSEASRLDKDAKKHRREKTETRKNRDAKKQRREASRLYKKSSSHSIFLTFFKSNF